MSSSLRAPRARTAALLLALAPAVRADVLVVAQDGSGDYDDIQAAAQKMLRVENGDVTLDLAGYWEHAFSHWITKTNPSLTTQELLSLKGYIGEQVCKVHQEGVHVHHVRVPTFPYELQLILRDDA